MCVKEGSLEFSTAKSYRSMVAEHLRPAFGECRSDRLRVEAIEAWRAGVATKIEKGKLASKFYINLRNLLHSILECKYVSTGRCSLRRLVRTCRSPSLPRPPPRWASAFRLEHSSGTLQHVLVRGRQLVSSRGDRERGDFAARLATPISSAPLSPL